MGDALADAKASVGPGWGKILEELFPKLKAAGWDGDVHQVKEKFGGLRFYIGGASPEVHRLIDVAEEESLKTCEDCGGPGSPREGDWVQTLCDEHAKGRPVRRGALITTLKVFF